MNFLPSTGIIIHNIKIIDHRQNELISAQRINILPFGIEIKKNSFSCRKVSLSEVNFNLITYEGDSLSNLDRFLLKLGSSDPKQRDTTQAPVIINCLKTELKNIHFKMQDQNRKEVVQGMNYSDLDIVVKNLLVNDFKVGEESISGDIKKLIAKEKCGFSVDTFKGKFFFTPQKASFKDTYIESANNKLNFDLTFNVTDWSDLSDFINKVHINADFKTSKLLLSDLRYFSPSLDDMKNLITFSGLVKGTISDFHGDSLDLNFNSNTVYRGSALLSGLPYIESTFMSYEFDEIITKKTDLGGFLLPGGGRIELPEIFSKFGTVRGKGRFDGFLDNFVVKGDFSSLMGRITTDVQIHNVTKPDSLKYNGMISASGLELGKLIDQDSLIGKASFVFNAKGSGYDIKTMKVEATGNCSELFINNYNLTNIRISGLFDEQVFTGSLGINDENLVLNFDGSADLNFNYPVFDFKSEITCINFPELNIIKSDSIIQLSTHLNIRLKGNNLDNLIGGIYIDSTKLQFGNSNFFMKSLSMIAFQDTGNYREIQVHSDFADIDVTGNYQFAEMSRSLLNFLNSYTASSIPVKPSADSLVNHQEIEVVVNFKNTSELTRLFFPAISIFDNAVIKGKYDTRKNIFRVDGEASKIQYAGADIYDWKFSGMNTEQALKIDNRFQRIFFTGDSRNDTTAIGIDSVFLLAGFSHDTLNFKLDWNDIRFEGTNMGDIDGLVSLSKWPQIGVTLNNSTISINDRKWLAPHINTVVIDTSALLFNDFLLTSEESELRFYGCLSDRATDTMNIFVSKINVVAFNPLLEAYETKISGELSGKTTIIGGLNSPVFYADVFIDNLFINEDEIGDIDGKVNWDKDTKAVNTDLKIIYTGNAGSSPVLALKGSYFPYSTDQNFDFTVDLSNLNLKVFNPFLVDVISHIEGAATGHFDLKGTNKKPDLTGKIKLMRTGFVISYLNTKYSLADDFEIKNNIIEFNNIVINDTAMNKAILSGRITHKYLSDFFIDLKIDADKFSALNTNKTQNSIFYGTAAATGTILIQGPVDNLRFDINAASNPGTNINIPLNLTTELNTNSFIVWKNTDKESDSVKTEPVKYSANLKGLSLNMDLKVTRDAQIAIYLPANLGKINATGSSDLKMNVSSRGDFSMLGDYIIDKGEFSFTFQKLVSKKFEIEDGGKISFSGNPLDALLNVSAIYRTKPTLMGLPLATDTANMSKRVNAQCVIILNEKLMNPEIRFSIRFTGLDEEIKQLIYATIDTNDQAVMSQQVISLLLLNTFSYTSTNNGTVAFSTIQMLSNQIGNVLSKFSDDFDIGLNYNPGSATASEEFEVDLHGQLFDSRLIIDGNFGVKNDKTSTSSNTSNIVGDVNIEYKVTPDGRFRVRAFNRTNDLTLIEKSAPYTQGIGFLYRKDFENFKDFFKKKPKHKQTSTHTDTTGAVLNKETFINSPMNNIY